MRTNRGGNLWLLWSYRIGMTLLVGGNLLVAGLVLREFAQNVTPVRAAAPLNIIGCTQEPSKLTGAKISITRPGLTQVTAEPLYYDVHGLTPEQIGQHMNACSAGYRHGFAAETSYFINWQVSYRTQKSSQCVVDKVAVGLHLRHVYPRWYDTSSAATTARRNEFMQNLVTHEEGHSRLAQQYAARIQSALKAIPPHSCNSIATQVNTAANGYIQSLNQANDNYDTATNHGSTQGAVL